jgi:hypothetical protein
MLRRLHFNQLAFFASSPAKPISVNGHVAGYPEGCLASAIGYHCWRADC